MRRSAAVAVLALCALVCGCKSPKYALYTSLNRDFQCDVPWAWNVMYDSEGTHFTHVNFIGPFEPDFYLGAPSYSVRWYSNYATHRLRDGRLEMYAGPDDFIRQTLDGVYGADRDLVQPVHDVAIDGLKFKCFTVVSAGPAQPGARWGTAVDGITKQVINPRQHAYAILPMRSGFYVLTYPATTAAFKTDRLQAYKKDFEHLVNSFVPFKDGPGGAPLPPSGRSKPAKPV
ncbi:MAG: hypothetical protein HY926_01560 [Elusimicrobia bacterium]|nr:hypothetical protein [Elusimicrobiota bacterium]